MAETHVALARRAACSRLRLVVGYVEAGTLEQRSLQPC